MGLPASAARLFYLTARLSDLDGSLMRVSNNKISLARDTTSLSEKYTRALNKRSLEFSLDGTDNNTVNLSYDLFMTPNSTLANNMNQYILTNTSSGRVILNDAYMSTLSALGNVATGTGGDFAGKYTSEASFLAAFGLPPRSTTPNDPPLYTFTTSYTVEDLKKQLATATFSGNGATYASLLDGGTGANYKVFDGDNGNDGKWARVSPQVSTAVNATVSEICATLSNAVVNMLSPQLENNSTIRGKLQEAAAFATSETTKHYSDVVNRGFDNDGPVDEVRDRDKTNDAVGANTILWEGLDHNAYIDLNQVIMTFLYYFDQACAKNTNTGTDQNGAGTHTESFGGGIGASPYVAGKTDITGVMGTGTASSITSRPATGNDTTDSYKQDYYANLYAALCQKGWVSNSYVSGTGGGTYIENGLSSGTMSLQQLNQSTNSWTTLTTGDPASPLRSIRDDDDIAAVKAWYDTEKSKIEVKEEELDVEKTMYETERTATSTEIDSVKGVLNKNIDRSYKMFQKA